MAGTNLFLKPDEAKFLGMAVANSIDEIKEASQDQTANWNPRARTYFKEMLAAGTSLKIKLEKLGIPVGDMDNYLPGDEDEFLTKES